MRASSNNRCSRHSGCCGGSSDNVRSSAFRFRTSGQAYGAEMFEWWDGNPGDEDRRGCFVTVRDGFIHKTGERNRYIPGVVSATPAIIGDCQGLGWWKPDRVSADKARIILK